MADRHVNVLLVGGGAAADACAGELRERGFDGSILLAARELDPPYDRTTCSKELMRGEKTREQIHLHPDTYWEDQNVELLTRTSVLALDTHARTARLSTELELSFDHAVIGSGAMVRRLNVDGAELEGIHYLRAPGNAETIRADVENAEHVVLIGGSYIGCEVAASLTTLGKRCTIVMLEGHPLERGFGPTVGRWVRGILEEHGVEVVAEAELGSYRGADGRVRSVVTTEGRELTADAVVVGAGVKPDVMLARAAGLSLGATGGIECDSRLRTSADGIWAAGDACEYDSVVHGRRLRVEHWEAARAQGKAVGAGICGDDRTFEEVPYFWCDIADWAGFEYVGPAQQWDTEVVRGSLADGNFSVWYLDDNRLAAMLSVGRGSELDHASRLLASKAVLSPDDRALMGDPEGDLAQLR